MDTSAALIRTFDQLADLLDEAADTPPNAPTPCTDFDVAALRHHIVGWLTAFADGFVAADHTCGDANAVTVTGSGGEQVRAAAGRLRQVLPGALTHPLNIGESGMPGDMAASMILWEYQMHGWDLAQAAGLDWNPDDEAVEASLAFAPAMLTPDFQGDGKAFATAVPVDESATPLERLVGLSGRRPMR
ncbi:TIGR03086 family metal-binding protein [Gordonia sp. MP11Mi]|uniref:TIGR03086 family protein n=1 Tax=Gordonia sp. MP11Mi TaxID=3022769 RepID=A0AA97CSV1_9ACTN